MLKKLKDYSFYFILISFYLFNFLINKGAERLGFPKPLFLCFTSFFICFAVYHSFLKNVNKYLNIVIFILIFAASLYNLIPVPIKIFVVIFLYFYYCKEFLMRSNKENHWYYPIIFVVLFIQFLINISYYITDVLGYCVDPCVIDPISKNLGIFNVFLITILLFTNVLIPCTIESLKIIFKILKKHVPRLEQ